MKLGITELRKTVDAKRRGSPEKNGGADTKPKGTGGRPTQEQALLRDKKIVEVATRLFLERGYANTSLNDIATTAGVAKRTLYNLFGDKSGIFDEIIRLDALRTEPLDIAPDQFPRDPEELMVHTAKRIREVVLDPLTTSLLQVMSGEAKTFPELIARNSREGSRQLYNTCATMLKLLKSRGDAPFSDAQLDVLAIRFYDTVVGMSALRNILEGDFPGPSDEELRERVRMFYAYLLQKATSH